MTTTPNPTPAQAKATPRPWRIGEGGDGIPRLYGKNPHTPLCQFGEGIDEFQHFCRNWKANAALIVSAVNSFDQLKAQNQALRAALQNILAILDSEQLNPSVSLRQCLPKARAALAQPQP